MTRKCHSFEIGIACASIESNEARFGFRNNGPRRSFSIYSVWKDSRRGFGIVSHARIICACHVVSGRTRRACGSYRPFPVHRLASLHNCIQDRTSVSDSSQLSPVIIDRHSFGYDIRGWIYLTLQVRPKVPLREAVHLGSIDITYARSSHACIRRRRANRQGLIFQHACCIVHHHACCSPSSRSELLPGIIENIRCPDAAGHGTIKRNDQEEEDRSSCMALSPSSSRLSEAFPDLDIRLKKSRLHAVRRLGCLQFVLQFVLQM